MRFVPQRRRCELARAHELAEIVPYGKAERFGIPTQPLTMAKKARIIIGPVMIPGDSPASRAGSVRGSPVKARKMALKM